MSRIFTIPKAGTYFMIKLMTNLGIPTPVHHYHSKDMPPIGNRSVVLIRDLRDVMCSVPFWIDKLTSGAIKDHPYISDSLTGSYLKQTKEEKLLQCISLEGLPKEHMEITKDCCQLVIELMKKEDTFVLRFEDLVAESVGGNLKEDERVSLLQNMCQHIGHPRSKEEIQNAIKRAWGKSPTYNPVEKKVHRWKVLFEKKHQDVFIKLWDALNVELGYSSLLNLEDKKITA